MKINSKKISISFLFILFCLSNFTYITAQQCNTPTNLTFNVSPGWGPTPNVTNGTMDPLAISCAFPASNREHWFTFTTPAGFNAPARITALTNTGQDITLALYTGACGSLTEIACTNDNVGTNNETMDTPTLTASTLYRVRARRNGNNNFALTISVQGNTCTAPKPLNLITGLSENVNGITPASSSQGLSCVASPGSRDSWFQFSTGAFAGRVRFTAVTTGTDVGVAAYSSLSCSSAASEIACVNNVAGTGTETLDFDVVASTTYFVKVQNVTGTAAMGLTASVVRLPCSNPTTLVLDGATLTSQNGISPISSTQAITTCTGITGDRDAWYQFNTGSFSGTARITVNSTATDLGIVAYSNLSCTSATQIACVNAVTGTGSEFLDLPVISSTLYYIRVRNVSGNTAMNMSINITSLPCSNPTAPIALTIDGATVSGIAGTNPTSSTQAITSCTGITGGRDAWFQFSTGNYVGLVRFIATSTTNNIGVVAYSTLSCTSATQIACINATGLAGETENLDLIVTASTTYYIRVRNVSVDTPMNLSANIISTQPCSTPATITINGGSSFTNGLTPATATQSVVNCTGIGGDRDAWYQFNSGLYRGDVRITVSSPTNDIAIVTYSSLSCVSNLNETSCANNFSSSPQIETLDIPVVESTNYFIRIISVTGNAALNATISLTTLQSCSSPTPITVNGASVTSFAGSTIAHAAPAPVSFGTFTQATHRDGWLIFNSGSNTTFTITATSATRNLGIQLYQFDDCPTLTTQEVPSGWENSNAGAGSEILGVSGLAINTWYRIRVVNMVNTSTLDATITVSTTPIPMNSCSLPATISIGTYNFPLERTTVTHTANAPTCMASFDNTKVANTDAWAVFNSGSYAGSVTIEYTSATKNTAITVYNTATPCTATTGQEVASSCANTNIGTGMETSTFTVVAGTTYHIRISNVTDNANMGGTLSLYAGTPTSNSCAAPATITIGTCNLSFERSTTVHSAPVPSCFNTFDNTKTIHTDGWASFNSGSVSGTVTLEYTSYTKNIVLAVYATGSCPTVPSQQIACVNGSTTGTTRLIFAVTASTNYLLRVVNRSDNGLMQGTLCLLQGLPIVRDNCINAQSVVIGQTNVDAPFSNTSRNNENRLNPNSGACAVGFDPATNVDTWVRFTATTTSTRISYTTQNNKNIALAVYANCVTSNSIPNVCANAITTNSQQEEFINQPTIIGVTYFVRIMNLTDNQSVQGFVSIINGVFDDCANVISLATSPLQLNTCNLKFTFPASFGVGIPAFPPAASGGFDDAWTRFTGNGQTVRLEYQGNKGIAMAVYTGASCGALTLVGDLSASTFCGGTGRAVYQKLDVATTNGVNYLVRIINMQDGNGLDGSLCISTTPTATPKLPANNSQPTNAVTLNLDTDCGIPFNIIPDVHPNGLNNTGFSAGNAGCGGTIPSSNIYAEGWARFNTGTNTSIVIRYDNQDFDPFINQNGVVIELRSFADPAIIIACANSIALEGIEQLVATGLTASTDYYIRIAAVGTQCTAQRAIFGRICLSSNTPQTGDLCSNAHTIVTGQCNITMNIPANFTFDDPTAVTTCRSTNFAPATMNDAWITFTAASNRTDISYTSLSPTNADPAFAVYVGNCGTLAQVGSCINSNTGSTESSTISTVVGNTYYIRVMNVFTTGTNNPMNGRICVQQTLASDVCDDLTLTTVPVGTCGGRLDIPIDFDRTDVFPAGTYDALNPLRDNYTPTSGAFTTTCDPDGAGALLPPAVKQDAWFRINGTGSRFTIHFENINGRGNPAIAVYTAPSAINCGTGANGAGNPLNELGCANAFNVYARQTESIIFNTNPGQQYLVRVMNVDVSTTPIDPANNISHIDMAGLLCFIAEPISLTNVQPNFDNCSTPRPVNIGDCDIPINVLVNPSAPTATCEPGTPPTVNCSTVNPPPANLQTTGDGATNVNITCVNGDAWATFTTSATQTSIESGRVTITYNNDNNSPFPSTDVTIAIYRNVTCGTSYTLVGNTLPSPTPSSIGCSERVVEGLESVSFLTTNSTQYWVRIINRNTVGGSAYGRLCIFNGPNIAEDVCSVSATSYGIINGDFKQFDVADTFGREAANNIPNCVVAGGSNPANPNPPIQRDAWMRFEVLVPGTYTVQYDNSNNNAVFGDTPNVALAIYAACPANNTNNNLIANACSNRVWEGTESITFIASTAGNFYVRVMNVSNTTTTFTGRIRIAAFASCNAGPTLIEDGDFAGWGNANLSVIPPGSPNGINRDANRPAANATALKDVAKFATMYGYAGPGLGTMGPEGVFTVGKTANVFHGAFFAYGAGYFGYGTNNPAYCSPTGAGQFPQSNPVSDACQGYNTVAGTPAPVPNVADANFMIVNGWAPNGWSGAPPVGSPNGKVWCQTVNVRPNAFYQFTGWFANVIQIGWNIDLPQLIVTICDMQDPISGAVGTPIPGTTTISGGIVTHVPAMLSNVTSSPTIGRLYGAAMRCNTGTESTDFRLKPLGSDIFLPEAPDRWLAMRCVYKSPDFPNPLTPINLCIENKSLTPNGNDFALDRLAYNECIGADPNIFNDFLKGNTCELADNPTAIGVALNVEVVYFDAFYNDDNKVTLHWKSSLERDLSHYEIQRSLNGNDFENIGLVKAVGNSTEIQTYYYDDKNLPKVKEVYYRLKMKTKNDKIIFGSIRKVNLPMEVAKIFTIYPNPIEKGQELTLALDAGSIKESVNISVTNLIGNIVYQQAYPKITDANNQISIPTKELPSGMYVVILQTNGKIYSERFIIL